MPKERFTPAGEEATLSGVLVETDDKTGAATTDHARSAWAAACKRGRPMTRDRAVLLAALILIGAAWGITQPFAKIAVSEGYRHFGIIFWQFALGGVLLARSTGCAGRACRWSGATSRFMSSSR
jgi:hypothetical protein